MNVLVLATTFPRWKDDSSSAFVYELSKRLRDKDIEIIVLAPHHEGAKFYEEMEGLKVYRFPYFYPLKYQRLCYNGGMLPNFKKSHMAKIQLPLLILINIFYIFRLIKKEKIDLIHAHWIIPSGFVCNIVKSILRKPLIVSVHGSDIVLIRNPYFRPIGRHILKAIDTCTVNSTATRDLVLGVFRSNKEPQIIPMGVDLNVFKPFSRHTYGNNSEKSPTILTVGRLDKNKGFNYLIDAMPKLIHKFPKLKLIIVGDGPEKNNLLNQIKNLHLEQNVSLAGAVRNKDLPKFYNQADLFVLPSLKEGLGVVLLEAMACGTPVIGSNVGGITDIIINGENGSFIKPRDADDIVEKVMLCLLDEKQLQKYSINGLITVTKKFSWSSVVEKFSNEYRALCNL
jgi:glycosyltransferase involved in cell wall biosynthesis